MKVIKKILALFLACCLVFTQLFMIGLADNAVAISVSSGQGSRGDIVDISVKISGNSQMQALGFNIEYDSNALEVVSATKGNVANAGQAVINQSKLGKIVYSFVSVAEPITAAGSVLDITFKIKDASPYGNSTVAISLTEITDGSFNQIVATTTDGIVAVNAPVLEAPSFLNVEEVFDNAVTVSWEEIPEATGYNVYLDGVKVNENAITDLFYIVYGLESNTTYSLQVSSLNHATESKLSTTVSATTKMLTFTVDFYNAEQELISEVIVEDGSSVTPPEAPEIPGKTFVGWSILSFEDDNGNIVTDFTNITADMAVCATYTDSTYTVTFVDWDGTILDTQTVNYGAAATAPKNPKRDGYVFTIWDCAFDNVTTDLTVTAQYSEITCEHANTETINARKSTCAEKGYAGDVYCNDCGLIVAIGGELDYAEHKYDSVITAPTPDAQGYTTHTCAVCGDSYIDSYTEYIDENAPQIIVASKKCLAGKTVEVTVALKNNPGIASAKLTLDFDTSALTLTKVTDAGNLGIQCHKPELTSPYTLAWMNDTATEDFTFNGAIVTLTFEIAEDAEIGDYAIDLSYDYENYDIWNVNVEKVKFAVVDGVISVIDTIIGDVNGDGSVNTLDRMALARYLANWEGYSAETIDMIAADVNNDGIVNTLDRMALARHLANWSGYEALPCEL